MKEITSVIMGAGIKKSNVRLRLLAETVRIGQYAMWAFYPMDEETRARVETYNASKTENPAKIKKYITKKDLLEIQQFVEVKHEDIVVHPKHDELSAYSVLRSLGLVEADALKDADLAKRQAAYSKQAEKVANRPSIEEIFA